MNSSTAQDQSHIATELAGIIRQANACTEQLLAILDEECDALSSGDVAKISACGQKKAECVNMLERLDQERTQMCRILSLADIDIDLYLTEHDPDATPDVWKQLRGRLERCRDANSVNGTLTRVRRGHIEQALHILRGGAQSAPALYGPDGMDKVNDVTSLGKA